MKYPITLVAALALLLGSAVAQQYPQQYPNTDQNQQYPQQYPNQYPTQQYPNQYPQAATANYGNMAVPAGTEVQIRTNENINADKNSVGRMYSAEIANNVVGQNGQVLIPQGSPANLTVQEVNKGGMGLGSNQVALALQSVTINGRRYNVASNPTTTQSGNRGIGANKRTAEMTGGGALLGTVIGAIAGGGKGALIGAVVGGAGGAAAQVLTRGNEVKVPAETLLTFKLDQPLMLQ